MSIAWILGHQREDDAGDRHPEARQGHAEPAHGHGTELRSLGDGRASRDVQSVRGRFSEERLRRWHFHRPGSLRSEEHTSELQSLMRISYAVFCLKKKTIQQHIINNT